MGSGPSSPRRYEMHVLSSHGVVGAAATLKRPRPGWWLVRLQDESGVKVSAKRVLGLGKI